MPVTDPLQGATFLPAWTDPYQVPQTVQDLYQFLLSRATARFTTKAELEAAFPAPPDGQYAWAEGSLWLSLAGAWVRQGPVGRWQAYSPTVSGINAYVATGRYTTVGNLVRFRASIDLNGPSDNQITLSLPVLAEPPFESWLEAVGSAYAVSGGGAARFPGTTVLVSNSSVGVADAGGTNTDSRWGTTNPNTWANGDFITISGTYEAA